MTEPELHVTDPAREPPLPLSWRIKLPWPKPPLGANDRRHHMAQARAVAATRAGAGWAVKAAGVRGPFGHLTVGLVYVPALRRRRDGAENYAPTLKACVDAIATDLRLVPDDVPEHVTRLMPVVADVDPATTGVYLTIEVTG